MRYLNQLKPWHFLALFGLILIYAAIFYLQTQNLILMDFSSYYSASEALNKGLNPYRVLTADFLPFNKKLPANVNPPALLWAVHSIGYLPHKIALLLWNTLNALLLCLNARLTYSFILKTHNKPNPFTFTLIYFAIYANIMNIVIGQMGNLIAFCVLYGYIQCQKNHDYRAGFLWGSIAACKLFPFLLLFYGLMNRRYRLTLIMLLVALFWMVAPLFIYGSSIYINYNSMMQRVLWFGDNWNISLFGWLFRLGIDTNNTHQSVTWIKIAFIILFSGILMWYLHQLHTLVQHKKTFQGFLLTTVVMLFLSPFGWYYYGALILPAIFWLWYTYEDYPSHKTLLLHYAMFCLLAMPIVYVTSQNMPNFLSKVTLFSYQTYGLMLLMYLMAQPKVVLNANIKKPKVMNQLLFGLIFLNPLLPLWSVLKALST